MRFSRLPAVGILVAALGLAGCGSSNIKEGIPAKIDMSKDYSPAAKANMIDPKDFAKAQAQAKKGAADAKAETAAPAGK